MGKTFSDNWYRVADLRLGLRPTVSVRTQYFRDEPWYVLHETNHNTFHRVDPATWRLLTRLSVESTVDEVWRASIDADPASTPGQDDVFHLLAALYRNNLLYIEGSTDEVRLLERGTQARKKNILARLSELMFMRIPLLDPEPLLRRVEAWLPVVFGPLGALLAIMVVAWGVVELLMAGPRAWHQAQRLLQLDNIILLYGAVFVSKALHEFGHAALCKRYGGEVRTMGVMLLMLTPVPYVDVSSSWAFRNRWQRVLVGAGGMLVDVVVAGLATIVWAHSPPGMVNELAYNLMFSTAIYTVVFNLNPLMRFDGYFILSDLLGLPNLHEQGRAQFRRWFQSRVLDMVDDQAEEKSPGAVATLITFFLASNVYRLFVMAGIVLFIADAYFGVGLLVAAALAMTSFVLPVQNLLKTLASPLFRFQQARLLRLTAGTALAALLFVFLVPMPDNRVLPGVAEARRHTPIYSETAGLVTAVPVPSGAWVETGAVLVELTNPELDSELAALEAQIAQTTLLAARTVSEGAVDLAPVQERQRTLSQLKDTLLRQRTSLIVRAPHDGYWVAPDVGYRRQAWLARGVELGQVVDDRAQRFVGVIRQEAAALLTQASRQGIEVRLEGELDRVHAASGLVLVPHSHATLPSAALSPVAGGQVPVSAADPSGRQSAEPFFMLLADIDSPPEPQSALGVRSGQAGWIRLHMPWRSLAAQAWVGVRQFFQRRYQL